MDEPDLTESAAKETVAAAPSSVVEESAVARGSQVIPISPERSARTENSVVEGLPEAKTERIASMRRELADLQQHLIQAQQRVAAELQGRVEDAERFEALETFVHEHELNSQKEATRIGELETEIAGLRATTEELRRDIAGRDARIEEARRQHSEELEARSSSLSGVMTLLDARNAELATRTTERETEQATRSRLELELENQRTQHRDVTDQLELQSTSLRDAKALLATLTAELTATTSERDAFKCELESARRELDGSRTKLRDVANQLVRLGQDMGDGGVIATRPQPPPVPQSPAQPRSAVPTTPVEVETILMTEEAKPASRIGSALFMLGGLIVGCAVTIVIMNYSSSPTADGQGAAPSAAVAPVLTERNPVRAENVRPSTSGQPTPASDTVNAEPKQDSAPAITAPLTTDGVIVLPASAAGHRVFVDGRLIEVKNSRASVLCGSHEVRIGSSGAKHKLDIACGGETALPDEPREK